MSRKVLYLDIETSPMEIKTWGVWDQNALRVDEEWVILGAAYAWDDGPVKAVYPRKVTDWKENRTEREAAPPVHRRQVRRVADRADQEELP